MAASGSSTSAVLAIVELVEAILLPLGFYDLVHATATCRALRDVINGSTVLREKIWLHPKEVTELLGTRTFMSYAGYRNQQGTIIGAENERLDDSMITAVNPALANFKELYCNHPSIEVTVHTEKLFAFAEDGSRWLQMYVTQPAAKVVSLECVKKLKHCDDEVERALGYYHAGCPRFNLKIKPENGVRLSDMYEALIRYAAGMSRDYEKPSAEESASQRKGFQAVDLVPPPFVLCHRHVVLSVPGHVLDTSYRVRDARRWSAKHVELGWVPTSEDDGLEGE